MLVISQSISHHNRGLLEENKVLYQKVKGVLEKTQEEKVWKINEYSHFDWGILNGTGDDSCVLHEAAGQRKSQAQQTYDWL